MICFGTDSVGGNDLHFWPNSVNINMNKITPGSVQINFLNIFNNETTHF